MNCDNKITFIYLVFIETKFGWLMAVPCELRLGYWDSPPFALAKIVFLTSGLFYTLLWSFTPISRSTKLPKRKFTECKTPSISWAATLPLLLSASRRRTSQPRPKTPPGQARTHQHFQRSVVEDRLPKAADKNGQVKTGLVSPKIIFTTSKSH